MDSAPPTPRISRRRALEIGGLLLIASWFVFAVVAEWVRPGAGGEADRQVRDKGMFEARYSAGWLTRYVRHNGAFPAVLPHNMLVGTHGGVVEACVDDAADLARCDADWAWCARDLTVRALACPPNDAPQDGGYEFTLWPQTGPAKALWVIGADVVVPEPQVFEPPVNRGGAPHGGPPTSGPDGPQGPPLHGGAPPPPDHGPGLPNGKSPSS
ncbi:MAG: hypothetical protein QGH45_16035 [Myxococcota bacterium]|jgi:hypothetical protein|nr:hypothetical protein [Myxococcota bacterium]